MHHKKSGLLFWVVRSVQEKADEQSPLYIVAAEEDQAVDIHVHETVVHQQQPDLLHQLTLQEGEHGSGRCNAVDLDVEVLESIWELLQLVRESVNEDEANVLLTDGTYAK